MTRPRGNYGGGMIAPYESQVGISVASGGRAANYVGESAFVTPGDRALPQGMKQLAEGMEKVGDAAFKEEIRKRNEQIELQLIQETQTFNSDWKVFSDAYQQQTKGQDAANAEEDAKNWLNDRLNSFKKRWEGNDRAQRYIQQHAGSTVVSGIDSMRDYGSKQQEVWKDSVFAGSAAAFKDTASDPSKNPEEIGIAYKTFAREYTAYQISKGVDPTKAQVETDRIFQDALNMRAQQGFIDKINKKDIYGATADLQAMKEGKAVVVVGGTQTGMVEAWNIDLGNRPIVKNEDGSVSTVRSKSFNFDGKEVLIPTVSDDGKMMSDDEAIEQYKQTGKHLGKFDTTENATAFAKKLSAQQALQHRGTAVPPEKIMQYQRMLESAKQEKLEDDFIQLYSQKFPNNPDKAATAALQDKELAKDRPAHRSVVNYFDWLDREKTEGERQSETKRLENYYEIIRKMARNRDVAGINKFIGNVEAKYTVRLKNAANEFLYGEDIVTDPTAKYEMVDRIADGETFDLDAAYGDSVSMEDREIGKKMLEKREWAKYLKVERDVFTDKAKEQSKTLTKTAIDNLFSKFEASIPEGGFKDPEKRQKHLNNFFRKIVVTHPDWWVSGSPTIRGHQEREFAEKGYYPKKGAEYQIVYQRAMKAIRANGEEREPTKEELARVYKNIWGIPIEDKP